MDKSLIESTGYVMSAPDFWANVKRNNLSMNLGQYELRLKQHGWANYQATVVHSRCIIQHGSASVIAPQRLRRPAGD